MAATNKYRRACVVLWGGGGWWAANVLSMTLCFLFLLSFFGFKERIWAVCNQYWWLTRWGWIYCLFDWLLSFLFIHMLGGSHKSKYTFLWQVWEFNIVLGRTSLHTPVLVSLVYSKQGTHTRFLNFYLNFWAIGWTHPNGDVRGNWAGSSILDCQPMEEFFMIDIKGCHFC